MTVTNNRRSYGPTLALSLGLVLAACDSTSSPAPSPVPAPTGPVATLTSPVDGATVYQCEVFSGTTTLPSDKTLLLGMHNLDNHDPERYFQLVKDWEYPLDLHDWKGYQYFGSGNSSVGQQYRVELLIVDLKYAKDASLRSAQHGWHSPSNPDGAVVAAHITVKRITGPGPAECS